MIKKLLLSFLILFIIFNIAIFPNTYLPSVTRGFILFYKCVLPALFPFLFFTKLLTGLGFPEMVSKAFEKPVKKLFKCPSISAYIMFMSLLSGYPIGAKLIGDFYKNNLITTEECKKIITFSSTSAPIFVLGTVAVFMLNNIYYGLMILVSHYLSAIITGIIFTRVISKKEAVSISSLPQNNKCDNLIADSINDAVLSILSVGGLIAVFSVCIDIFSNLGFYDILGKSLSPVLIGLTEMTRGCCEIAKNPLKIPLKLAIIAALISFGGFCIIIQSMAFLKNTGIKTPYFILIKSIQGIFAFIIAYQLGLFAVSLSL